MGRGYAGGILRAVTDQIPAPMDPFEPPPVTWEPSSSTSFRLGLLPALLCLGTLALGLAVGLVVGVLAASAYANRTDIAYAVSDLDARPGTGVDLIDLTPGMCFDEKKGDRDETSLDSVVSRRCTEPHQFQVFETFIYDEEPWPGEAKIDSIADDRCFDAFAANKALTDIVDAGQVAWYTPLEATWAHGDRSGACFVTGPTTLLTSPIPVPAP